MRPKWFEISVAYSIAKLNMSMCALGHAEEFKNEIAGKILFGQEFLRPLFKVLIINKLFQVNTLWPVIPIWTAATKMIAPDKKDLMLKPEIMADAAYTILTQDLHFTGNFVLDHEILKEKHGITDFADYKVNPKLCFQIYASFPVSPWQEIGV